VTSKAVTAGGLDSLRLQNARRGAGNGGRPKIIPTLPWLQISDALFLDMFDSAPNKSFCNVGRLLTEI
jgi:hypothetical protein